MRFLLFERERCVWLQKIWLVCLSCGIILGTAAVLTNSACFGPAASLLAAASALAVGGNAGRCWMAQKAAPVFFMLGIGFILGAWRTEVRRDVFAQDSLYEFGRAELALKGRLLERPRLRRKGMSAVFQAEQAALINTADGSLTSWKELKPAALLWLTWPGNQELEPGTPLAARGKLQGVGTSGSFAEYSRRRGIRWQMHSSVVCRRNDRLNCGEIVLSAAASARTRIRLMALKSMPAEQGRLFAAMALGDSRLLSEDLLKQMRSAGLGHVLAASGLHVGLLVTAVWLIVQGCGYSKRRGAGIAWLLALSYAVMAGLAPSIVRAVLMLSLAVTALSCGRPCAWERALAAAAAASLLADPLQLAKAGFQLSYAAVLGIGLWYRFLRGKGSIWLIRLGLRPRWLWEHINDGLSLTTAVSLLIWPLLLHHFKQFTFLGFVSNLIVLPVLELAFTAGLAACCLSCAGLSAPLWQLCAYLENFALREVRWLNCCPLTWTCADFPAAVMAAYYFGLAGVWMFWVRGRKESI